MKRFFLIAMIALATVALLDRVLRRSEESDAAVTVIELPVHTAEAELTGSGLQPPKVRVPKDHQVRLVIHGAPEAPEGLLTLLGYEDRCGPVDMGPGPSRAFTFVSDRPGDDFAFRLGAQIVGRLEITGSHLEEGHE